MGRRSGSQILDLASLSGHIQVPAWCQLRAGCSAGLKEREVEGCASGSDAV